MNWRSKDSEEFYVGYWPASPKGISSFIKRFVLLLLSTILLVGVALVLNQRNFSKSEFKYNTPTTLSGLFMRTPVPRIRVAVGRDWNGKMKYQSILLVGFGKHGSEEAISTMKSNSSVKIKGHLIYYGGKSLLQINNSHDIEITNQIFIDDKENTFDGSNISVVGEIVDPKCYFGVMKPAEGKAHRSCAIRCIAGGIPPVFHQTNSEEYFIITAKSGESLISKVIGIVGDQIQLKGQAIEMDDWKVLQLNAESITEMAVISTTYQLLSFDDGITICSTH